MTPRCSAPARCGGSTGRGATDRGRCIDPISCVLFFSLGFLAASHGLGPRNLIVTTFHADSDHVTTDDVINMLLEKVPVALHEEAHQTAQG